MPPTGRWLRGQILRLAFNRGPAAAAGILLIVPAALLMLRDYAWESGATDGMGLVLGATGVALVWTSVSGRRSDWIEPE